MCRSLVLNTPGLYHAVSLATREPRPGETHGVDYHFVTDAEFDRHAGEFITGAPYNGSRYADLWPPETVDLVLFEVTIEAALNIRRQWPNTVNIWLDPVGDAIVQKMAWLSDRLDGRGSETPKSKQRRLDAGRRELAVVDGLDQSEIVRHVNASSQETAQWLHDMIMATAA
jgi:guanylate kinase